MRDIIKQINELFLAGDRINFYTHFEADALNDCTTLEEALPKIKELYAPDGKYKNEIENVRKVGADDIWEQIDSAFAWRGEYDASMGIKFSENEEKKLKTLQQEYKETVKSHIHPDTTIYSFRSSRSTWDLFGLMILNKDGKSLALLAENSD